MERNQEIGTFTSRDGTEIFYEDWGAGQPVVFSHVWPLAADAWDAQMMFLCEHGHRVLAHDRRGHDRSSQPSNGNDMDVSAPYAGAPLTHLENSAVVMARGLKSRRERARDLEWQARISSRCLRRLPSGTRHKGG
jgi:pimeloyl-ACP methyl ester carboxylesterase